MSDVLYVCRVQVRDDPENGSRDATIVGQVGSQVEMECLAAYAYGAVQAERQEMVSRAEEAARKRIMKPVNKR
jgi:hypothetical protein